LCSKHRKIHPPIPIRHIPLAWKESSDAPCE
jgi:hypothetical protein